jgi:uncharacterized BrkB/YihY/UPF0761 family membrane protein
MKERIHEEISAELDQTTKTDKMTVVVAIVLNFVLMFINMVFSSRVWITNTIYETPPTPGGSPSVLTSTQFSLNMFIAFLIVLAVTIAFDYIVIRALSKGSERRTKLTAGLVKMYQEEGLDKYYDSSIAEGYKSRYDLYRNIVLIIGFLAVAIPLVFLWV